MPTYEYRCERGHTFEATQRMSDDPLVTCVTCDAPVQRVLQPVAVHFKGSGFYNTDYGTRKRAREKGEGGDSASSSDSESKPDSKSKSKSDSSSSSESKPSTDSKKDSKPAAKKSSSD